LRLLFRCTKKHYYTINLFWVCLILVNKSRSNVHAYFTYINYILHACFYSVAVSQSLIKATLSSNLTVCMDTISVIRGFLSKADFWKFYLLRDVLSGWNYYLIVSFKALKVKSFIVCISQFCLFTGIHAAAVNQTQIVHIIISQ